MKYIGGIITAYIVLLVLDIIQSRNHKRTQSIKKFTIRTITDVSMLGAIGAGLWVGILILGNVFLLYTAGIGNLDEQYGENTLTNAFTSVRLARETRK